MDAFKFCLVLLRLTPLFLSRRWISLKPQAQSNDDDDDDEEEGGGGPFFFPLIVIGFIPHLDSKSKRSWMDGWIDKRVMHGEWMDGWMETFISCIITLE